MKLFMAITILNQSLCPICAKQLRHTDQVFSFPSFVQNAKDPYFQFNDSSFHVECLRSHPLGLKAMEFANQFLYATRPENRICIVGGDRIKNMEDYIFIDLLTSNDHEDLYRFNFVTLCKRNLEKWKDRKMFLVFAAKFKELDKWGDISTFHHLDYLIERISGS